MTLRSAVHLGCLVVAGLLVSCAPRAPQVARLEPEELQRRYARGLGEREAALSGVDADLHLWVKHHGRREPGVEAVLVIGGTDRLRVRVGALFGTALDARVDGERVRIHLPRANGVWDADAARPPISFPDAGAWLVRAWSATWNPPAHAWGTTTWNDSLLVLHWVAQGESLAVGVGPSGLPREVTLRSAEHALKLTYEGWRVQDGLAWPVRLQCRDLAGTFEVTARLRIMWFRPLPEDRLEVDVPEGVRQLDWAEVQELLHLEEGS